MRPNSKIDLTGTRYYGLSDRVKVLLLERLHGSSAPEVRLFHFLPNLSLNIVVFEKFGNILKFATKFELEHEDYRKTRECPNILTKNIEARTEVEFLRVGLTMKSFLRPIG